MKVKKIKKYYIKRKNIILKEKKLNKKIFFLNIKRNKKKIKKEKKLHKNYCIMK